MEAFHSFWSKPNKNRNDGKIVMEDYEILVMVLSALEWKKHNGRIRMVTDSDGAKYFREKGLYDVWDEVDTTLDRMDASTDPFLFWAAGKLMALKYSRLPLVMLDTDLIIWKNLDLLLEGKTLMTAHAEPLHSDVYPARTHFKLKDGYTFDENWDWATPASNTAFLYIASEELRDSYVSQAERFFANVCLDGLNPVTAMCFAEQRILPMEAKALGYRMAYLLEFDKMNEQSLATHLWGAKQYLKEHPAQQSAFCERCLKRIKEDFGDEIW
ncbi:DUF6734 family protein [Eubacterium oxidoreducens]|uniref:DUF6734 domain-containing protein n=1 Tax=Eubacterium oxidoreducens TaxID=1732 RepID=A0A1G6AU98_EUBOX|nr:DUF6734 family protein [Eubacterium oxidoreducens]SDB11902.1 hypothetical protein SAMN02910417_00889 [Eubacterium oxidoreducens]